MPPQAAVLGAALAGILGWNYQRSTVDKKTISMWGREHPVATAVVLVGFNAWIWPHLYRSRT